MKSAVITLLMLALLLTGLGVFGVIDHIASIPGWEAASKNGPKGNPREGTVARALKDYQDSLDRSRTIGLAFSLSCLVGGLGLGAWAGWKYFHPHSLAASAVSVCNICGAKLSARQAARGLCDSCQKRAL
jgi:uncharacterized membrane protein YesL